MPARYRGGRLAAGARMGRGVERAERSEGARHALGLLAVALALVAAGCVPGRSPADAVGASGSGDTEDVATVDSAPVPSEGVGDGALVAEHDAAVGPDGEASGPHADGSDASGDAAGGEVVNECGHDVGCDDGDACTVDRCVPAPAGAPRLVCEHAPLDCALADPCLQTSCDPVSGCDTTVAPSGECCFVAALSTFDFESESLDGAAVSNLAPVGDSEVVWRHSAERAYTGAGSAWLGRADGLDFDSGAVVASELVLPGVTLPAGTRLEMLAHVWADVEPGGTWDTLSFAAGGVPLWAKGYDNFEVARWQTLRVDLSAFAGQTIELAARFDSVDPTGNDGEGVYLDAVWVLTSCSDLACASASDCDDGLACTSEGCVGGICAWDATGGASCCATDAECDDSDHCTVDLCVGFACTHPPVAEPGCCNVAADCHDDNPCTNDACLPGTPYACSHGAVSAPGCCESAADCGDGDPCTLDLCDSFKCVWVQTCCEVSADCHDSDDVCTAAACVAGTCAVELTGAAGCCEGAPWTEDFDGPPGPWTFSGGGGGCHWQIVDGALSQATPGALHYGNLAQGDFDCGVTSASAVSGPIALQPGPAYELTFWAWMDTEPSADFDSLSVIAHTDGGSWEVWDKPDITPATWFPVSIDVSAFGGTLATFELYFATIDGITNDGAGVFVDDIELSSSCLPRPCETLFDCSDALVESQESCAGGTCSWSLP